MKRTMNLLVLFAVVAVIVAAFFIINNRLSRRVDAAESELAQVKDELNRVQSRQDELKTTLEQSSTDAFIENVARTVYGYMSQDEVLFVVTNPEALYEDGVVPER